MFQKPKKLTRDQIRMREVQQARNFLDLLDKKVREGAFVSTTSVDQHRTGYRRTWITFEEFGNFSGDFIYLVHSIHFDRIKTSTYEIRDWTVNSKGVRLIIRLKNAERNQPLL